MWIIFKILLRSMQDYGHAKTPSMYEQLFITEFTVEHYKACVSSTLSFRAKAVMQMPTCDICIHCKNSCFKSSLHEAVWDFMIYSFSNYFKLAYV
jgi:hypothetical protein